MRAWASERWLLYKVKGETHNAPVHRLERAGGRLVVLHDLGTGARTLAGADALGSDAVRLAGVG